MLQLLTAFSEVVSIGSLLPFVAAMTDVSSIARRPWIGRLLSNFGYPSDRMVIAWMGVLFGLGVLIANCMRLVALWSQHHLSARIGGDLGEKVFETTLHQDYLFHTRNNTATLLNSVTQDVSGTVRYIEQFFSLATNALIVAAIAMALLFYEPGLASAAAAVVGTAYALVNWATKKRLLASAKILARNNVVRMQVLQEAIGGAREILMHRLGDTFVRLYRAADLPLRQATADSMYTSQAPRYLIEPVGVIAIVGLCVLQVSASAEPIDVTFHRLLPVLGALALGANRLLPAAQSCYAAFASMTSHSEFVSNCLAALARKVDPARRRPLPPPLIMQDSVAVRDVWFSYAEDSTERDRSWVLKGLSLHIPVNRTVAFVGMTGGGKSTTADVILGLIAPARGSLLVDGAVIDDSNKAAWQASIAHVPQSVFLADSSFAENIAFGVPKADIDMQRVRRAAALAQINEFIEARPSGYDDVVGERGVRLSGGQRQRVGIARALYRMAQTIVFDEATSALDQGTEKDVMGAIAGLTHQITIILIAHRLSTVRNADRIFVFEDGLVTAEGTYDELLESSEAFRRMAT